MIRLIKRAHFGTKAIYLLHLGTVATSRLSDSNATELFLTFLCEPLTLIMIKEYAKLLQVLEALSSLETTQDGNKHVARVSELAVCSQNFQRTTHMNVLILASIGVDLYSVACAAVVMQRVVE